MKNKKIKKYKFNIKKLKFFIFTCEKNKIKKIYFFHENLKKI